MCNDSFLIVRKGFRYVLVERIGTLFRSVLNRSAAEIYKNDYITSSDISQIVSKSVYTYESVRVIKERFPKAKRMKDYDV